MRNLAIAVLFMSIFVEATSADALTDAKEGLAAQKRGDYASARYFYVRAIQNGATLPAADLELAYVKIAEVDLQLGNHDAAWGEINSALKINPSDPEAVHVFTQMQTQDAQKVGVANQCLQTCSTQNTSCNARNVSPPSVFSSDKCIINGAWDQGCADRNREDFRKKLSDYDARTQMCRNQNSECINACKSACAGSCRWQ